MEETWRVNRLRLLMHGQLRRLDAVYMMLNATRPPGASWLIID